jgi:hypothetical protein
MKGQAEEEVSGLAAYAGTMQAIADFGHGVHRLYRPTLATAADGSSYRHFTGQTDHGAEVWTWSYYTSTLSFNEASARAFTEAYNRRILNFIANPAPFRKSDFAATQPAR